MVPWGVVRVEMVLCDRRRVVRRGREERAEIEEREGKVLLLKSRAAREVGNGCGDGIEESSL